MFAFSLHTVNVWQSTDKGSADIFCINCFSVLKGSVREVSLRFSFIYFFPQNSWFGSKVMFHCMYICLVDRSSENTKANNGSKQLLGQEVNSVSLSPNHNLLHTLECFGWRFCSWLYFSIFFCAVNSIFVTFSPLTNTEIIIYLMHIDDIGGFLQAN